MSVALRTKRWLARHLDSSQTEALKRWFSPLLSRLFSRDLCTLALLYGTDKWNDHWYAQHYQKHLEPLRGSPINILEIGIGGFDDPEAGGESLRMWKSFFPKGKVFGIDIVDKAALEEPRIRVFQGDQSDAKFLQEVVSEMGTVDVIIDDGSHVNEHVIASFVTLFPLLAADGIYAIEDLQTSYWPHMGGQQVDRNDLTTSVGFLKALVDGLNFKEFRIDGYTPSYFDENIIELHFYHNLAVIQKGNNATWGPAKP